MGLTGVLFTGCGRPAQANIELRKQNQLLQTQLTDAQQQIQLQANVIRAAETRQPTVPTLPPDRMEKLFTTHGIAFGKLTGPSDPSNKEEKPGFDVYIYPVDQTNQRLKAAGAFVVEAFDLAASGNPRIGRWAFSRDESAKLWSGYFVFDYYYVLNCPWQQLPEHSEVLLRATFTDELTQLTFSADRKIQVQLPTSAIAMPTSRP